jgi:hypothetical protein
MVLEEAEAPGIVAVDMAGQNQSSCPYVGLRSYREDERHLFFGRDHDARRLVDKIFSARLTLFYGPSGVGKSSLLLAGVVPRIRDPNKGDAIVVVFDRWGGKHPETAIKHEVSEAIGPDAAGVDANEPLAAWARLVNQVRRKPLVLILDQFEQCLLTPAEWRAPLRTELAVLMQAAVDAHVVLALREEFLAGLEVFAREIVTIYDSKFRLEHLSDDGTKEAIVRPAESFGVSVEPALVEALKEDLKKHDETAVAAVATIPGVELPFLQIVCKKLWESQDPSAGDRLSLDLYTRLEGARGIIRRYVEGLANKLPPRMQDEAAEVLRLLAPRRSGIKHAYDVKELSYLTKLPAERVEQSLAHFASNWVLRERLIGGVKLYELYHDAYIHVLDEWIEKRIGDKRAREVRARLWKRLTIGGAATVTGALLLTVLATMEERRVEEGEIERATNEVLPDDKLDRMNKLAGIISVFEKSAEATWRRIEKETDDEIVASRLDGLETRFTKPTKFSILTSNGDRRDATREDYIQEASCVETAASASSFGGNAVVTLSIPANLDLDKGKLRCAWTRMISALRKLTSPVILPSRIAIESSSVEYPSIKFASNDGWRVEIKPGHVAVPASNLEKHERLHRVLEKRFGPAKHLFIVDDDKFDQSEAWMLLPRWTLPLLRAAKIRYRLEEVAIIDAVLNTLLQHQEATLTPPIVNDLIRRTEKYAPSTVKEAIRARGDREGIRNVLLEMAKIADQSKKEDRLRFLFEHTGIILDMLGQHPRPPQSQKKGSHVRAGQQIVLNDTSSPSAEKAYYTDDQAAVSILEGRRSLGVVRPSDLTISVVASAPAGEKVAPARGRSEDDREERTLVADYGLAGAELPPQISPVGVLLGDNRISCLVDNRSTLKPELQRAISKLRKDIRKRYGVHVPGIKFTGTDGADEDEVIVELSGVRIWSISDPPTARGDCIEDTMSAIGVRLDLARGMWLFTDDVDRALDGLADSQQNWLRQRYTLTDLKLLLRAVLSPEKIEIEGIAPSNARDGRTVRDLPTLLQSVIFWTQACQAKGSEKLDVECLVMGLRETQRARFGNAAGSPARNDQVTRRLADAVNALVSPSADAANRAATSFAAVVTNSRQQAKEAFPRVFATRALVSSARRLEQHCAPPLGSVLAAAALTDQDKAEIDDFFDAAHTAKSADGWRRMRICRLRSYDPQEEADSAADELDKLLAEEPRLDWSADDAAAVAVFALKARQQGRLPDGRLDAAKRLFTRAFEILGRSDGAETAEAVFDEARTICGARETRGPRWCWSVLRAGLAAYGKPNVFMNLQLGSDLAQGGNLSDARYAFDLFRATEKPLNKVGGEEQERLSAWLRLGRAWGTFTLARNGVVEPATALATLPRAADAKQGWPSPAELVEIRVHLSRLAGDPMTTQAILAEVPPGEDHILDAERMSLLLTQGDLAEARRVIKQSKKMDEITRTYYLAILQFLREPAAELETAVQTLVEDKHPYADYMQLLLFVSSSHRDSETAKQRLGKRWTEIEPVRPTWNDRLHQGDITAWQEMLIGYFLGHVAREQILAWIDDPKRFMASPLAGTNETRSEYLAEMHFYDAQLQSITGDPATRRERTIHSLRQAVASGGVLMSEYVMSAYQLRTLQ